MLWRVYLCRPICVAPGDKLPRCITDVTFVDRFCQSEEDAEYSVEQDYGDRYLVLGIRRLAEEIKHDDTEAYEWLEYARGVKQVEVGPKKPKPEICPEVWFKGKFDQDKAMKAVHDLCEGAQVFIKPNN